MDPDIQTKLKSGSYRQKNPKPDLAWYGIRKYEFLLYEPGSLGNDWLNLALFAKSMCFTLDNTLREYEYLIFPCIYLGRKVKQYESGSILRSGI